MTPPSPPVTSATPASADEPADLLRELGLLGCRIARPEHAQLTHLRSVRPLHSRRRSEGKPVRVRHGTAAVSGARPPRRAGARH